MPKRKDIVGQQFDELTVVEMLWNYEGKRRTYCRCIGIDGNEYIVRQDALTSGATHTIRGACSGGKQHDISGKRFGKLIAVQPIKQRASNGGVRWECICDCGNKIYPTMNNLKRGHTTSCGCVKAEFLESCKLDIIGKRFGMLVVIDEIYSKNNKRRTVLCKCDCGNKHICTVNDLTSGSTSSCGCYKKSKGESFIAETLDKYGIDYIQQKTFDGCKNKKHLRFDFYLPQQNTCLEYDGAQHTTPVKHWGGEQRYVERIINDNIKNNYCKDNDINLIRIPYTTKKDEIDKIIYNLMSPATTTV